MERRTGILRNIRRQWSPYRVYSDAMNDHTFASGVKRKTEVEILDKYYFFVEAPLGEAAALYEGDDQEDPDATVLRLWDPVTNPFGPIGLHMESHRIYRAYSDLGQLDATGEPLWDGSTLSVTGWAVRSPFHETALRFHETAVLTRSNNLQTLIAQYDRNGNPYWAGAVFRPWVNADTTFGTVLAATGTWRGATNLVVRTSDRPFPEAGEYVAYVWRGYGGQRPSNPLTQPT